MTDVFAWTFPGGKLKIISASETSPNGTTTVNLRPDANKRWIVLYAHGYHDDAVNRTCNWQFYDGTTKILGTAASIASTGRGLLTVFRRCDIAGIHRPTLFLIVLSRDVYAQFEGAALATGKKVYVEALVVEIDI